MPYFKQGNYGEGMVAAVQRVKQFLEDPDSVAEIYSNEVRFESDSGANFLGMALGLFLLIYGLICSVSGILQYNFLFYKILMVTF